MAATKIFQVLHPSFIWLRNSWCESGRSDFNPAFKHAGTFEPFGWIQLSWIIESETIASFEEVKTMPCSSTGYIVQNGTNWKQQSSADVQSHGGSAESHAERQAYKGFGNKSGPYLIVQDAFPCFDKCHQYFLNESRSKTGKNNTIIPGYNIIIKVTADNTNDAQSYIDKKVTKWIGNGSYPYYMYYCNGNVTFRAKIPNAPQGFPPHPSPASV